MKRLGNAWIGGLLLVVGTACEGERFDPVQVLAGERVQRAALIGLWTGTAEIAGADELLSSVPSTGRTGVGFAFPVALQFDASGTFTLWTFNLPPAGDFTIDRFCDGVFALDQRTLEFFPSRVCRALPLHRFRFTRQFGRELFLEARPQPALPRFLPTDDIASVQVRLKLRRD